MTAPPFLRSEGVLLFQSRKYDFLHSLCETAWDRLSKPLDDETSGHRILMSWIHLTGRSVVQFEQGFLILVRYEVECVKSFAL